jgi:hypothetical protein
MPSLSISLIHVEIYLNWRSAMKTIAHILAISLFCLPLAALADASQDDQVTLKDGRILRGEIIDESSKDLTLKVHGVKRVYSRDFISKVNYGEAQDKASTDGSNAEAPQAVEPEGSDDGSLDAELAVKYQVPQAEVVWVRRQGITDDDLPVLFSIAAEAQVLPSAVVKLRLAKMSWNEIRAHFGLPQTGIDSAPQPRVRVEVSGPPPVPVILPPPNILFRILFWPFLLLKHLHR